MQLENLFKALITITTFFNKLPIEVHAHIVEDDLLRSINIFAGHSARRTDHLIQLIER